MEINTVPGIGGLHSGRHDHGSAGCKQDLTIPELDQNGR